LSSGSGFCSNNSQQLLEQKVETEPFDHLKSLFSPADRAVFSAFFRRFVPFLAKMIIFPLPTRHTLPLPQLIFALSIVTRINRWSISTFFY
jgi:hypothetical protein